MTNGIGYGSWKASSDFTETAATVRLVGAIPIFYHFITVDPEIAYYKGLGKYKNSAFSFLLGFAIRL